MPVISFEIPTLVSGLLGVMVGVYGNDKEWHIAKTISVTIIVTCTYLFCNSIATELLK